MHLGFAGGTLPIVHCSARTRDLKTRKTSPRSLARHNCMRAVPHTMNPRQRPERSPARRVADALLDQFDPKRARTQAEKLERTPDWMRGDESLCSAHNEDRVSFFQQLVAQDVSARNELLLGTETWNDLVKTRLSSSFHCLVQESRRKKVATECEHCPFLYSPSVDPSFTLASLSVSRACVLSLSHPVALSLFRSLSLSLSLSLSMSFLLSNSPVLSLSFLCARSFSSGIARQASHY